MEFSSPEIQDKSNKLSLLQRQVVDFFVDGVRVLGLPRSLGEIYGILYISTKPLSLDDLVSLLGISKGSASQGLRTLKTLGAIRQIEINDNRKTYYEPATELKRLVGGFIREQVRPHLDSGKSKLQIIQETALNSENPAEREFFTERVERLKGWSKRSGQMLPILQKFLGQ